MAFLKQLRDKSDALQKDEHAVEGQGMTDDEKQKLAKETEAKYGKKLECEHCHAIFYFEKEFESHKTVHACKILDYLYLGNRINAADKIELTRFEITHVLNCTEDLQNFFENGKDDDNDNDNNDNKNDKNENKEKEEKEFVLQPKYLRISLKDRGADVNVFEKELENGITFIENANKENGNVFVHCQQGISRSSTMVIAYLMKLHCNDKNGQWNFAKTLKYVKDRRAIIQPIQGFQDFLLSLEDKWNIKPKTTKAQLEQIEKDKGIFIDNDMDLKGNRVITDPQQLQKSDK